MGVRNKREITKKQKSLMKASAFGFYDAQPCPCHPERSKQLSIVCEVEPDQRRARKARDLRAESVPPRRSSKRCKRFDFQKSAICCRFLKVRLRKHPHGMFSPLRMTRGVLRFSRLFRTPIGLLLFFELTEDHSGVWRAWVFAPARRTPRTARSVRGSVRAYKYRSVRGRSRT